MFVWKWKRLSANILILLVTVTTALSYENNTEDGYGTEWMYFLDENETMHVMNFSNLPENGRGMFFGDAYFHLYTRRNTDEPELLNIPRDNSPLRSNYFNSSNDIKAVTHGWMSDDKTEWLQNIKDAYLRKFDYNVITVDWSEISKNPIYPWPALSTRYVGKRIAKLLESLMSTYKVNSSDIHLIGHSLGAQVMGYAGMFSKNKIFRITGLDPARPLFELPYMERNFRLEQSDAEFVDIIHTCGGVFGYRMSHGHADFYPNNGRPKQPGCEGPKAASELTSVGAYNYRNDGQVPENEVLATGTEPIVAESLEECLCPAVDDLWLTRWMIECKEITFLFELKILLRVLHGRSCEFFGESIESEIGFVAYPCDSYKKFENGECKHNSTNMGHPVATSSRGDYYLHTNSAPKYAMGDECNT